MAATRVLVVDDHALVRGTLSERLEREPMITVVGTAADAETAIDLARRVEPEIILMDIDMPGRSCFDAARTISAAQPDIKFIFLSAFTSDLYIEQALRVGALAYLTKGETPEQLVRAILSVAEGKSYFSQEVRERIVLDSGSARLSATASTRTATLTQRELEVLRYISRGLAKKEIAQTMHISVKTVDKHASNLMDKLDVHDRVELTRLAIREGLTEA